MSKRLKESLVGAGGLVAFACALAAVSVGWWAIAMIADCVGIGAIFYFCRT